MYGMRSSRVLVFVAFLLVACGESPPPIPLDAARPDGGVPRDAGSRDGGALDAGDAGDAGSTVRPDGGIPGTPTCVAGETQKLGDDRMGDRTVGLAAGTSGFGLAWNAVPDGEALSHLHAAALSPTGVLGPTQRLTTTIATRRPVTLAAVGESWLASWVDNDPETFEVRTMALTSELAPGTAHHVTATAAGEDSPVLLARAAGTLLAWVETDGTSRVARAVPLDEGGAPMGSAATASAPSHQPGALALGELRAGPVLVYTSTLADGTSVFVQKLNDAGGTRGQPSAIDTEGNAVASLDAALGRDGGAVVFDAVVGGVRREVRFRALDEEGAPVGDERVLAEGTGASIAAFAGGYAVSYRASGSPAEIRVLFVSQLGEVVAELPVAQGANRGGRTTVRVSADGQIAVAWADTQDAGTALRVVHLACGGGA